MKSLSRKPFYSSTTVIVLLPILVFVLHIIVVMMLGMKTMNENRFDKVFHIVGGVSVYFSVAGIVWHLIRRNIIDVQDTNVFGILVYGCLSFVIISWEILEYIVGIGPDYLTYADTVTDMMCGLIGGLFAMLFVRRSWVITSIS